MDFASAATRDIGQRKNKDCRDHTLETRATKGQRRGSIPSELFRIHGDQPDLEAISSRARSETDEVASHLQTIYLGMRTIVEDLSAQTQLQQRVASSTIRW